MSVAFNKKIRDTFNAFSKDDKLYRENIKSAMNALNTRPTVGDIDQILCASCVANSKPSNDFLSYSEFAVFAMEVFTYNKHLKSSVPKQDTRQSMSDSKYDVFLGGSCNPTTWRKDTVIPYLEKEEVTYYNPQVEDWYPELIQMEETAKKSSYIKLYVFDSQTRAIASLVEAAFMASIGWRIVVVLHYLSESKEVEIAGETLTKQEVIDLNRGRSFLCDILEKLGVPVFDNLDDALKLTCDVIQGKDSYDRIQEQNTRTGYQYGRWILKLRRIFNQNITTTGNDYIKANSASLAVQDFLQTHNIPSTTRNGLRYLDLINCSITFDMFCVLTAEAVFQCSNSFWGWGMSLVSNLFQYTSSILKPHQPCESNIQEQTRYHVFLGGSCGDTTWRKDVAIPLLEASDVSYYNPQLGVNQWTIRKINEENTAKETSKVILFVISKDSPSIASLTEASYLMGYERNVYLVIEDLDVSEKQGNYRMTPLSQKDNKRARMYIRDTAKLYKVPVFPTIHGAVSQILSDKL